MNLKRIEMSGFKSFADKTTVELVGGMTAIVGPNGCGKSNVVDALRWSLGEMSPRSLRSKHMLDVIFAGSGSRAPLNLSEVTLTFDNAARLLPIDYTEVQVTRRLFRSGESEYFLNRTQCRLKDIRDLFMDTGMTEGYSILAQGEVDFVINAKPEERRELFEEAAGISKYKARREEALHKLGKVDDDLSRLNDILSMVENQRRSLENAAKKAKNFQELKEELKNLEIRDCLHRSQDLTAQLETKRKEFETFAETVRQIGVEIHQSDSSQTEIKVGLDAVQKELFALRTKLFEIDKAIGLSEQSLATAQEREGEFTRLCERSKAESAELLSGRTEIEERIKILNEELSNLQNEGSNFQTTFEILKSSWQAIDNQKSEIEKQRQGLTQKQLEVTGKVQELKNSANRASSLKLNKEMEIASIDKELEKAARSKSEQSEKLGTLRGELEQKRSVQELDTAILTQTQGALSVKEAERSTILANTDSKRSTKMEMEAKLSALAASLEQHPYRKGTDAILKQNFSGCLGVVGVLLKYSSARAEWVEAALGPKINYLVFETLETAQAALNWLAQSKKGRATCLVLDKIPETQGVDFSHIPNANSLLHWVQCDAQFEKLRHYLLGSAFMAGSIIFNNSVIDGGADMAALSESNAAKEDHNPFLLQDSYQKQVRELTQEIESLTQSLANLDNAITELKTQISDLNGKIQKSKIEINHGESLLKNAESEIALLERETQVLENQKIADSKELETLAERIHAIGGEIQNAESLLQGIEAERVHLEQTLEAKVIEVHRAALELKESEVRNEAYQSQLNRIQEHVTEWRKRLENSIAREQVLTQEAQRAETQIAAQKEIQAQERKKVEDLSAQKTEASAQIEINVQKQEGFDQQLKQIELTLVEAREREQSLTRELHSTEILLRTQETDLKNISDRLKETYGLSLEEAAQNYSVEAVDHEALAKLKKRVENLSNSVNLEAPEEYKTLSERYAFLTQQRDDLTKAKTDLKNAISQINQATKEQFRETFEKVRENFQQIFGLLFSGGVADLRFTDETNVLETGIEIFAQPPGKKLQNLGLLSGGEKTLTATALLFSFFMVKPSPFCVMDEVDAPLDPANVGRYLKLLKDFSNKTQFLVVTHNPKTMEMADILYGVTMEESGVSRVLSARIKSEDGARIAELSNIK